MKIIEAFITFVLAIVVVAAVLFISFAWTTWLIMLAIGILHHTVFEGIDPAGFWALFPLGVLVTLFFTASATAAKNS